MYIYDIYVNMESDLLGFRLASQMIGNTHLNRVSLQRKN